MRQSSRLLALPLGAASVFALAGTAWGAQDERAGRVWLLIADSNASVAE
jgi:hypothetical protein